MRPIYAVSFGWEHAEVLPEPERVAFIRRWAEIRASRPPTPLGPHWFISPAAGREGCDTCGRPHAGHPDP